VKYMLLAYTNVAAWESADVTSEDFQAMCDFYEELEKELTESGEFVESRGLSDPSHSKVVRKQDGVPVATDGPFAEAKEALVSYSILDCESYDRALEIAARVVDFTSDTVEVRPLMDDAFGMDM
jgi:hypothetical protein